MASTAETTITIMYQFTHFFNVLKASLQEENEAIWQNDNRVLHVNLETLGQWIYNVVI